MSEPAHKKRKYDIPILGDEDDQTNIEEKEIYNMMQIPPDEARKWFSRVDRTRARKGEATLLCPSCCVSHPMHTVYHHIIQCISLRLSLQGLPSTFPVVAPPKFVLKSEDDSINTDNDTDTDAETVSVKPLPQATSKNNNTVSPKKDADIKYTFDVRCCVPVELHGAGKEKKIQAVQISLVLIYGEQTIRVCQLDHWKDETLTPWIVKSIVEHPSTTEGTLSENCKYKVCGTRREGPKKCSKILRLNSFKFQEESDAFGFFCCVEHAIMYAASLSKPKVSNLVNGGKLRKEKGKNNNVISAETTDDD